MIHDRALYSNNVTLFNLKLCYLFRLIVSIAIYMLCTSCTEVVHKVPDTISVSCSNCNGQRETGFILKKECYVCNGTGVVEKTYYKEEFRNEFDPVKFTFILFPLSLISYLVIRKTKKRNQDVLSKNEYYYVEESHSTSTDNESKSIFIIGPEGSGKTVFLAALSNYIEQHENLILDAKDIASSNYVVGVQGSLENATWPISNPQGHFDSLNWEFGYADNPHDLFLFDYSGQDMRTVLLNNETSELQGRPKKLRKKIDQSDLLIYLLDLEGLIGGGSAFETNENSWLLKIFLSRKEWSGKHKLIVVTKADLYQDMIEDEGGNLKEIILKYRPKVSSKSSVIRELENIDIIKISSVETVTKLIDGKPVRLPKFPIESKGFKRFVKHVLSKL